MRYQNEENQNYKWRHLGHLLQRNIPNLETLQKVASHTAFVAIDAEPWGYDGKDAAEIAISVIQLADINQHGDPPTTLTSLRERFSVQTHTLKVCGREQGKCQREPTMGKIELVQPDEVESALVNILESVQPIDVTVSASSKALESFELPTFTLVGFDLQFEIRVLSTQYPGLLPYFSSWIDLQEVVKDVRTNLWNCAPSMRDTLIAFGFGDDFLAVTSKTTPHSAGTDTVRMVGLLVKLLSFPLGKGVQIERTGTRSWSGRKAAGRYKKNARLFSRSRPSPRELYPFTARIRRRGGTATKMTAKSILDIFSEFNPTAVGGSVVRDKPLREKVKRSRGRDKQFREKDKQLRGWICLPSLDELETFLKQVNGRRTKDGGVWEAVSCYDPATSVQTAAELSEFREAELAAGFDQKMDLGMQKKEDTEMELDALPDDFNEDGQASSMFAGLQL
ncbi:hypothetical protein AK830_g532 [Neonectria ditissima]|uniref:Uncharacterized protein n=1 Tax=Neonectria ditissima TaxID=78410 RepID=A0A0P7BGQ7_9HYPO|nr:hypothetical protein AK830_g532 [Neonectria ditissima]